MFRYSRGSISDHSRIRSLDEQMIMDGHEAGGVKDPVAALIDVLEGIEELQAVRVILESRSERIPRSLLQGTSIQASSRSRGR
jgi:hypothetical protein